MRRFYLDGALSFGAPRLNSAPMSASASSRATATGLGRLGVWSGEVRFGDVGEAHEAAAELDELGYGALWIPGGIGGDVLGAVDGLLGATRRMGVATGIINIWKTTPAEVGAWWAGQDESRRARLMLGLGVSHGRLIGEAYRRPLAAMAGYLDGLDAAGAPAGRRCLAALGPRMLDLARERTAGTHPYLAPVEHTAFARERLGPDALVAPEQSVVLETDPARAREIARAMLTPYAQMPNYVNNWRRFGLADEGEVPQLNDRLVDALFAWGSPERIAQRVREQFAAGADHVCLQVVRAKGEAGLPRSAWRELAQALL